ncbi:hypothetical protein B0H17DRAFT_1142826 [Mycena rosella]|uniref:Uncharacterized protein n=1 Tax=Mycena rosella TaxID=1033263 RepID=A0AAD7G546_MYCRO|nr:hypothetical protein B0H17DRAFT_1142826 [Mycena rosella]
MFELPEEASLDIWTRAWKWIHWLDTYRDLVPAARVKETYALYMALILDLQTHGETKALIDTTPGVRLIVTRAWVLFLELDNCVADIGFHDVCCFIIQDLKASLPAHLEEVIEGAGGSVVDLALVNSGHSQVTAFFLVGVIGILDQTAYHDGLKNALLSAGVRPSFPAVLTCMEGAINDAHAIAADQRFKRSQIYHNWARLVGLVTARVKVARAYDAGKYPSERPCHNTESSAAMFSTSETYNGVGRATDCYIVPSNVRRFTDGSGYRDVCSRLRALRLTRRSRGAVLARPCIHARTRQPRLYGGQGPHFSELMHELPVQPYCLEFDYTQGDATIELLSIDAVEVPATPSNFQAQWLDRVARAARSGGRMQVAIMHFLKGGKCSFRMISLHSRTVHDGLRHIVNCIPKGTELDAIRPSLLAKVCALDPVDIWL